MAWSLRLNQSSNRYMQRAFTLLSTMRAPAEPRALGGGWRGEEGSRVTSYLVGGIDDLADHAERQIEPELIELLHRELRTDGTAVDTGWQRGMAGSAHAQKRACLRQNHSAPVRLSGSSHSGLMFFLNIENDSIVRSLNFFFVRPS